MIIHRENIRNATILLLPLLLLAAPLLAADDVTMESFLGFNGFFKLNTWTPLTIILENRGRSLEGTLAVQVTSGSEYYRTVYDTHYSMEVTLPANSKKRCAFTVHIDNFSRPLLIRFKQGDHIIRSESINLREHYSSRPLVVAAGRRLSQEALSPMPPNVLSLTVRARYLPETRYGYQGVRLLILDAGVINDLNDRQFEAVVQWLEAGGYLMIAGEMNLGFFSRKRISDLLPLTITGFEQLNEIQSLKHFCGFPIISDTPFLALKTSIKSGEALVMENSLPILVKKSLGWGSVFFLAVDYRYPPLTVWRGIAPFWQSVLALASSDESPRPDLQEPLVVSTITEVIGFRFPNFYIVLCFIIAYVIVSQLIFKKMETKQLRTNKIPALGMALMVTVLCISAYFTFLHQQNKNTVRYNGFLHMRLGKGQYRAHCTYTIGLYAMQKTPVSFDLGQRFHPIRPILMKNQSKNQSKNRHWMHIHENKTGQTIQTPMEAWSKQYYHMEAQLNFPLKGHAFKEGNDLILEISNHSSHTILESRAYYEGRVFFIGDISPDQHLRKRITAQMIHQTEKLDPLYIQFDQRTYVKGFAKQLFNTVKLELSDDLMLDIHQRYNTDQSRLCLFGWMASEVWSVKSNDHQLPGEHTAFMEWEIAVTS